MLLKLVDDCERFILKFFDVIKESAMHIYHSALAWSPMSSLTRQLYQSQMMEEVKLVNGIDAQWDACIRAIPIHDYPIGIVFSHKGSALAVVSSWGVKIFETATGVTTFEIDSPGFRSIDFSPDDDMLLHGGEHGTLKIWDVQTSDLVQSFEEHGSTISSVAFSPCGNMIVSGSDDNTVRIWDVSSGRCKFVLKGHSDRVWAVCWSGTGDRVITGSFDGSVRVWDVSSQTCSMILHAHTLEVTSVASSCDSSLIASGSRDGTVQVYDARSGDVLQTTSTNSEISLVQFSTHGDKLRYANSGTAEIWDLSKKEKVWTIFHRGFVSAFSPDGTRVASGDLNFVKIWTTENGYSNSETVNHYSKPVDNVTFAPDGQVVTSRSRNEAKIWDTTSGDCLFTIDCDYTIHSIVFSPNSAFLVCLSYDRVVFAFFRNHELQFWNVHTRSLLVKFTDRMVDFLNVTPGLSPCGSRLVSLSSSHMILWDLRSGKHLAHLDVDFLVPRESRITFAVDGASVLFTSSGDEIIQCWRISPAPSSSHHDHSSDSDQSTSHPLVFIPIQDKSSHEVLSPSVPIQCCRYEGHHSEWILDEDGKRILWLPPDRRDGMKASECNGKKVAVGTKDGRVYVADFSDVVLR
jgi:WD40 repeat protein